ncbi:MAG: carboxypeptidase regulatory-like domain-containing protein [Candidatus Eisenbacteria bacterium]|nr:carboxypeptidase regulatory-like domain-containing protein [Candidatus Eisenbacteria bacterium]
MRNHGVTLLALALWATPALAAAHAPHTLLVRGRVSDPDGAPIVGARILRAGAREPAALSDADGRFAFTCEIGSLAGLARAPFHEWFRASCEGWRFAAPAGSDAVALELRAVPGADGAARLRVRSNDARAADLVAKALAAPGAAVAELTLGFTGRRGKEGGAREPKLTAALELPVALEDNAAARPARPAREPAQAAVAPLAPEPARASVAPPAPEPARAAVTPPGREPAAAAVAPRASGRAPTAVAPPAREPARAAIADTAAVKVPAGKPERLPERPESLRLFPSAPEPGAGAGRDPIERFVVADTTAPPPARHGRVKGKHETAQPVTPAPLPLEPAARDTGAAGTGIRISVSGDSTAAASDTTGGEGRPGSPIRVRSGRAVPEPAPAPPAHDRCTCTVQGTVEVRSDKPLAAPLRVEVLLGTERAPRDTVELFMGAPRPFEIRDVPCGRNRLALRWPAARRFAVVSRDALEPFACAADRPVVLRVVLEPR